MPNYILRIARDEWEKQVFALKAYYAGVRREWTEGDTILLVKKASSGDSFVGYGIIDDVIDLEHMNDQEKAMCKENNWNTKLSFEKLSRFEPSLPVRDTVVSKWGQKGALLHGAPINQSDLNSIIKKAKVNAML